MSEASTWAPEKGEKDRTEEEVRDYLNPSESSGRGRRRADLRRGILQSSLRLERRSKKERGRGRPGLFVGEARGQNGPALNGNLIGGGALLRGVGGGRNGWRTEMTGSADRWVPVVGEGESGLGYRFGKEVSGPRAACGAGPIRIPGALFHFYFLFFFSFSDFLICFIYFA
jgi:hypothetical protein